jgi:hypothetical protein
LILSYGGPVLACETLTTIDGKGVTVNITNAVVVGLLSAAVGVAQATVVDLTFKVNVTAHSITDERYVAQDDPNFIPTYFQYTIRVDTSPVTGGSDSQEGYAVAYLGFPRFPESPFTRHLMSLYPSQAIQDNLISYSVGGSGFNVTSRSNGDRVLSLNQEQGLGWQASAYLGIWHYTQNLTLFDFGPLPYALSNTPSGNEGFVESVLSYFSDRTTSSQWYESAGYVGVSRYHIGSEQGASGIQEAYRGDAALVSVTAVPEPETYTLMSVALGLLGATTRRKRAA